MCYVVFMSKSAKLEGTCGVCEGSFKVRGTSVVLHGYNRPGEGYIVGRCFGEGRDAWEVSSAPAEQFLAQVLVPNLARVEERLADFDGGRVTTLLCDKPLAVYDLLDEQDRAGFNRLSVLRILDVVGYCYTDELSVERLRGKIIAALHPAPKNAR